MKADELIKKVEDFMVENDISLDRFCYEDIDVKLLEEKVGTMEYILVAERGTTGDHDTSQTVVYFKEYDIYLSLDGYYNSQDGSNFDYAKFKEVKPKKVTTTIYS